MDINFADESATGYLIKNDNHCKEDMILSKIKRKEYIIAKNNDEFVGFLRFGYLWSKIPYIEVIAVEDEHQRKGIGKAMLMFLEDHARKIGEKIILSSSEEAESAPQEWHKHMGFKKAGRIDDLKPVQESPEIIFIKKIKEKN